MQVSGMGSVGVTGRDSVRVKVSWRGIALGLVLQDGIGFRLGGYKARI